MQQYMYIILAVIAGMALPIQAALNSRLGQSIQQPVGAAFFSFLVGTFALFIYLLITRWQLPGMATLKQTPAYLWVGGLLGAVFVSLIIILVPKLGVALTFSLVIAGQMLLSVLMDHYGWVGVQLHSINAGRIIGMLLLIAGVIIIRKF